MRRYLPLIFLAACVGDSDDPVTPGPIADCVPDEAAYEATVRPLIEANCARCHGTSPNFGAPFSLLTYAPLLEGQEGGRIVDEIVREVQSGSMPPAGAPDPSAEERATIVEWASCGAETVSSPLEPTRPPFTSPNDPPPDLETIDLVAADLAVGPDVKDRYNDIDFTNLTDEDVFIRRFDAIVDESRVLHHLTLRRGDPALGEINMKYLYAWAPGTGAIEFPDGGIRLRPGDNLRLQIHYNNGAELEDIRDSSGVRLFVGEPSGREYEMFDPGPGALGFQIGARSSATITSTCTMREDAEMIAAMPHMHEIGTAFDMLVRRGGGDMESVLQLPTWDFESQLFYELPLDLQTGDELTIRCDYDNASSDTVVAGPRTEDEMCFAFAYVTPPPTQAFLCTETPIGDATELEYSPGSCISEPLETLPTLDSETFALADGPVFDEDGVFPEGHFEMDRFVLSSPNPGVLSIATITGAAQARRDGARVQLDSAFHVIAPLDGLEDGEQTDVPIGGTIDGVGPQALSIDCPAVLDDTFTFGTVDGVPAARLIPEDFGVDVEIWWLFRPVE